MHTEHFGEWPPHRVDSAELESLARVILGYDGPVGKARALTPDERRYMRDDAYLCSPSYPPNGAPMDDEVALCRWWLAAMKDYVDCL